MKEKIILTITLPQNYIQRILIETFFCVKTETKQAPYSP